MDKINKYSVIMKSFWVITLSGITTLFSCAQKNNQDKKMTNTTKAEIAVSFTGKTDTATFGTGCFWCTEAIFEQLEGVVSVTSGYAGGHIDNPTYEEVSDQASGHAECAQIVYDPAKITFDELLEVFWQVHDPTTLNRQGADVGPQYRSAIFYHNDEQKQNAPHKLVTPVQRFPRDDRDVVVAPR